MVSAHAPLAAWLREHRFRTGSGGGGSGGAGGGPAAPVGCMVKLTTKSLQVLEKQGHKDATKLAKVKRRDALDDAWISRRGRDRARVAERGRIRTGDETASSGGGGDGGQAAHARLGARPAALSRLTAEAAATKPPGIHAMPRSVEPTATI